MTIRGRLAGIVIAVLALSLAANLLIAGFVAARFVGLSEPTAMERIVMLGIKTFPPEIRRAILAEALSDRSELRTALSAFREARQKLFQTMRAEPFDPAALDAAFAEVRAQTDTLQNAGQKIIGEAVKAASPEARAQIAGPGD